MPRILISDPIAPEGVEMLRSYGEVDVKIGLPQEDLQAIMGNYDALVVRSETKVTADLIKKGKRLQVIGRAGVGTDNIDLEAATLQGIAVVNAPTSNIIAAAEHTITLLMALARHIPLANASLKKGEWRRRDFMGVEIRNKTLGIIGLGRVGSEVARRARGLEMRVIAHDPFVSENLTKNLAVALMPLEDLLKQSDFISLHIPLTEGTSNLIGDRELALVKPTAYIINVARGGIVDEVALYQALDKGRLAGAALDVFTQEPPKANPLLGSDKVIVTPHLGASTTEAQAGVAIEVAEQVMAVLKGQPARNTVNAPFVLPEVLKAISPYLNVASKVSKLASCFCEGQLQGVTVTYQGEIGQYDTKLLTSAALVGLLGEWSEQRLNLVNATLIAAQRSLKVTEQKDTTSQDYGSLITVEVATSKGITVASATQMRNEIHLLRLNDYWFDISPAEGYLLITQHMDRPGMIGAVGTIAGQHDINISFMEVGRLAPRGRAMMILGLDEPIPQNVLNKIKAIPYIGDARVIKL